MIGVLSVKLKPKNSKIDEKTKNLTPKKDLIEKWIVNDENFFPDHPWAWEASKEKVMLGRKTTLNLYDREFDDFLYAIFVRKTSLLSLREVSNLYVIKISDLTADLDNNGSGYKVRVKIYVALKRKLPQIDPASLSFNSIAGIIALILPLEGEGKTVVETFLKLTEGEPFRPSFSYTDTETSSEKTLQLKEMMIQEFKDKLINAMNTESEYEVSEEEGSLFRGYFIYIDSFFKQLVYSSMKDRTNLMLKDHFSASKLVALKCYIGNLVIGSYRIDWNTAPSLSPYYESFLKKELIDFLGPRAKVSHTEPYGVEYIAPDCYFSIDDTDYKVASYNSSEAYSMSYSIDEFLSKGEKQRDYRSLNVIWSPSWIALMYTMISAQELIFHNYTQKLSSSNQEASTMADLMEEAIVDFEEYYDVEILTGWGRQYFKDIYDNIKELNSIDEYYRVLKEKRDMFATKPFSTLSKLLNDQKTILQDQTKLLNDQKSTLNELSKNENLMFIATLLLLGVTVILAFETIAPFWLPSKLIPYFVFLVLVIVLLIIIAIYVQYINKKKNKED